MHSDLPKVLQPLAGRPLLAHVLEAARALGAAAIHVVYGHGGERVREAASPDAELSWAHQAEQLGTGHAVMQAMPRFRTIISCSCCTATCRSSTRRRCSGWSSRRDERRLALLTAMLDDPTGYGRIVRDAQGEVTSIVEEKDASTDERAIREVNTGLLAALPRSFCAAGSRSSARQRAGRVLSDGRRRRSPCARSNDRDGSRGGRRPRCTASTTECSSRRRRRHAATASRADAHARRRHARRSGAHRRARQLAAGATCTSTSTPCSKAT